VCSSDLPKGQPFCKETRYAAIQLISIPFVSVRGQLAQDLLDQPRPPAELMQALIRDEPRILLVSLTEAKLAFGRIEMDMHPARLALYAFFAERKKSCRLGRPCADCTECFLEASEVIESNGVGEMYGRIAGARYLLEMSDSGIGGSLTVENFQSYKSKIRQDILAAFGQALAAELEIVSSGSRPSTRYGLRIDRSRIKMEW